MGDVAWMGFDQQDVDERKARPTVVEVPSGRFIDMVDPDPADLTLEDIAHKLAQNNRWGGSSRYPMSVAQHAVMVSQRVAQMHGDARTQLLALHHDDHEAFTQDIPRPWKALLGKLYKRLTDRFDAAIAEALDLPAYREGEARVIKCADNWVMLLEAKHLMPSQGRHWYDVKRGDGCIPERIVTPSYWLGEMPWRLAKHNYLLHHKRLEDALR